MQALLGLAMRDRLYLRGFPENKYLSLTKTWKVIFLKSITPIQKGEDFCYYIVSKCNKEDLF